MKAVLHTHPSFKKARKSRSRARPKKGEGEDRIPNGSGGLVVSYIATTYTMPHETAPAFIEREKN